MSQKQKAFDTQKSDSRDDVNYDSFIDLHRQEESAETGVARLKSVQQIEDYQKLPDEYKDHRNIIRDSIFLKFKAEIVTSDSERDITIYVEKNEENIDVIKGWSGTDYIKDLVMKEVPIKHIKNNVYTIPNFDRFRFNGVNIEDLNNIYEEGYIDYDNQNKEWIVTGGGTWKKFKFILSKYPLTCFFCMIYASAMTMAISNILLYISLGLTLSTLIFYFKMVFDDIPRNKLQKSK